MDEKYLATGTWPEAIKMPGKAIQCPYNARKRLASGAWRPGLRPGPRWGSLQRSPKPLAGGDQEPLPALGPSGLGLRASPVLAP